MFFCCSLNQIGHLEGLNSIRTTKDTLFIQPVKFYEDLDIHTNTFYSDLTAL